MGILFCTLVTPRNLGLAELKGVEFHLFLPASIIISLEDLFLWALGNIEVSLSGTFPP
jgi:hypothetical protein